MILRILIADDHLVVREGLSAILNGQPDMRVVAEACDGVEALAEWRRQRPDLCLIDLRMPRLDGVAVVDQMRREEPDSRIVILTTYDGEEGIYQSVRAGARGYLLKDAAREALLDCVRRVAAGETCLPPELTARLVERISGESLTERESDVLRLLGQGLSNREISSRLSIGESTVKTHLKSIFGKLNVLSRTEAISVAARRGLISVGKVPGGFV